MKSRPILSATILVLVVTGMLLPAACRKEKKKSSFDSIAQPIGGAPADINNGQPGPVAPATWEEKYAAAQTAADAKQNDIAEGWWTQVVREAEAFGAKDFRYPMALNDAAYFHYFKTGKMNDAELLFRKLVEVRKEANGPDDMEVSMDILKVANLLGFTGRFDEAEASYKEALAQAEKNPTHEKYEEFKKQIMHDQAETLKKAEESKAKAAEAAAQPAAK